MISHLPAIDYKQADEIITVIERFYGKVFSIHAENLGLPSYSEKSGNSLRIWFRIESSEDLTKIENEISHKQHLRIY